jgi:hypothetical protein
MFAEDADINFPIAATSEPYEKNCQSSEFRPLSFLRPSRLNEAGLALRIS